MTLSLTRSAAAPTPSPGRTAAGKRLLPGLAVVAAAVAVAWSANRLVPAVAPLTWAAVLGVVAGNLRLLPDALRPGLAFSSRRLMRLGIALLGLKLALGDVVALGWQTVLVVLGVVSATFFGTQWLGRRAGLPGDQPLLIATGFSICGASAVAAMNGITESEDEDVVTAVALVTLCGTLAIAVLPLLQAPLGLGDVQFGRWTGASVHDVGQVVAIAQGAGPTALGQAVVVKLMRVALLAPIVAGVALSRRRARPTSVVASRRQPVVPLFVAGFLALVAVRTSGVLPGSVIAGADQLDGLLLAGALFALGSSVDVRALVRTGGRALLVGLASWLLIAVLAYIGVRLTT